MTFPYAARTGFGRAIRTGIRRSFSAPAAGVRATVCGAIPTVAPGRLVVMVPTAGTRCGPEALRGTLESIGISMALAARNHPGTAPMLLLLAQWAPPRTESDCLADVETTMHWWRERFGHPILGMAISPRSKILGLNASTDVLDRLGARTVAWFDDDILVTPDCLSALLSAWSPDFDGVVGGAKSTLPDANAFSGWWARRKNRVEPVNLYPHGCAVLMARHVFGDGIPPHYQSDDSYLLLRHLDPGATDPFHRLAVVPEAIVKVPAPNSVGAAAFRIARNYRNALRVAADAPPATVRYFVWRILFFGLRRPKGLREAASLPYWSVLSWHMLKFLFWLSLAAEIGLRAVLSRPRAAIWYEAPYPEVLNDRPPT